MTHLDEAADLQRRFGGLERLYGMAGAAAIRRAHVAVVGIGGVGSWAAEALARSGVGALTLVDLDHVAESNINRQVHAVDGTLGQAKVLAMRDRIAQIHPRCTVHAVEEFVEPDNWPMLLPDGVDAVIDACDELKAKTAMAAWARERKALRRGGRQAARAPGRRRRPRAHHARPAARAAALPASQVPRRAQGGKAHRHSVHLQPGGGRAARSVLCDRGGRLAELPRLRIGGERDGHLRPVRGGLGARSHRVPESGGNDAIIAGFAAAPSGGKDRLGR
jgi:hypothetical protein